MGSSRVGSNPTRSVIFITDFLLVVQQEPFLLCHISLAAMAEWLRRLTRNQMGSSRVGSNPTRSVCWFHIGLTLKISLKPVHCRGIEPRSPAWQARILPLNQQCLRSGVSHIWVMTWLEHYSIFIKLSCIVGESNPGLPRGRREFYHWTNNAEAINNHPSIGYHYPRFQWAVLEMCKMTTMGIEPTIFRFEVGRLIHWATRPMVHSKHLAIKYSILENITSPWHQKYLVSCMSIFSLNLAFLPLTRS